MTGGPRRDWRSAVPITVVVLLVILACVLMSVSRFRRGATALLVAVVLTAGMRLVLPRPLMGPLAVRSKPVDVSTCLVIATVLAYLIAVE